MAPEVVVVTRLSCGCADALVEDLTVLVACSADVCRDKWWCECVDPADPQMCQHINALLFTLAY